ncbi:MAG TPA: hypothetical protein VMV29_01290 [Ktedonobacterales bacterium]|nr:hypothetical protein [Ktedonobacterales bacterium]
MTSSGNEPWNIFARELVRILQVHSYTLWQLQSVAGIHSAKIDRLNTSLRRPKFNVLSPDDLDRVILLCKFTPDEVTQIRAAVLATAIEKMLMDRINQFDALEAGNQVYPILYRALKRRAGEANGLSQTKSPATPVAPLVAAPFPIQVDDETLELVIDDIDASVLLLHLADTSDGKDGAQYAQLARSRFLAILAALENMDDAICASEDWLVWHAETLSGLAHAEQRITKRPA